MSGEYIELADIQALAGKDGIVRVHAGALHNLVKTDVAPVIHAHWEFIYMSGLSSFARRCSHCKKVSDIPNPKIVPYCPNCGAKMDEEDI